MHLAVAAEFDADASQPGGGLTLRAPDAQVRATTVDRIVEDRGEPGAGADHVALTVTRPLQPLFRYEVGGTLGGGNLRVAAGT